MYSAQSEDTEAPPQPDAAEEEADQDGGSEEEDDDADETATSTRNANSNTTSISIAAVPNLDVLFGLREIGREALCWQLSSAKPGNGVEQVRDQSIETYWQSDGTSQPHWLQVHFARRVAVSHVCMYLDYNLDESYTPKKVRVEAGMTSQDLHAVTANKAALEFNEPVGWVIIPLQSPPDPLQDDDDDVEEDKKSEDSETITISPKNIVRSHLVRISIEQMHQNGRDTHVRQVQLYGPRTTMANTKMPDPPRMQLPVESQVHHPLEETFGTMQFSLIR